ncbi:hypothetical protein [Flavobacterium sp.]|uniref:hypothetical protein n=1 Tax=Flavobacterium sp. TaxID=239 RepID=UPI00404884FA
MKKILLLFFILSFLCIALSFFHNHFLNVESLEMASISKKLTKEQLSTFKSNDKIFVYKNFYLIILKESLNIIIISTLLLIGFLMFTKKINFLLVLEAVIKAKYIFLISIFFEIIYLKFILVDYTLLEINYYAPLSLINFFDYNYIDSWFVYPLQTINLFEVFFVLLVAYFVKKQTAMSMKETTKIVGLTYFIILLLWLAIVMFLILNYS